MPNKKLLILGGTGEAAELARQTVDFLGERVEVVVSYAGVTGQQPDLPCEVRVGGFGGAPGLIAYLQDNGFTHLIDATHPFAEQISQHAYIAANSLNLSYCVLSREEWLPRAGDRWLEVNSMAEAAEQVGELGYKTLMTIGVQELGAFAGLEDVELVVRLMSEPPEDLGLARYETVISRPPYDLEAERALLRDKKIRLLVTKNSGGNATKAKLDAARLEGAAVIMINRPPREPAEYLHTPMQAIQWLNTHGI